MRLISSNELLTIVASSWDDALAAHRRPASKPRLRSASINPASSEKIWDPGAVFAEGCAGIARSAEFMRRDQRASSPSKPHLHAFASALCAA
jgi:hypothetical protein